MDMKDFGAIDYLKIEVPSGYRCSKCGASGCKLWREYQTTLDHQRLQCAKCAGEDQKKDISTIDEHGRRVGELGDRTDQIGWLIPAVPTEEGNTFWGYTSVPPAGCAWWASLPTLPKQ